MEATTQNDLSTENKDALDKFHCFGSRWFCLQMQEAFSAQGAILGATSQKHENPKIRHVLPLIHGLQTTSEAISLLRRDGLLNETHVLMRLLTERALNLCYLLVAPPKEDATGTLREVPKVKGLLAHELIEHAKEFRFKENYDSDVLEEKIKAIATNTKIPLDFLRLMVASHYPQASLALSGSPFGAVFQWYKVNENSEAYFADDFATLLFGGITLLNHVIKLLGENGIPENLVKDSDASTELAANLMFKIRHPVAPNVNDAYGWWQNLSDHEYFAAKKLAQLLREFEIAFAACVEAGMEGPMLARQERNSVRLRICALYLKRMLNDVRSMWLMIRQGNTSQAGSIAASLFENALLIECLAENEARAVRFSQSPTEMWPWDKRAMCNFVNQDTARRENRKPDQRTADAHYQHYSWLCEIKHPTLSYVTHDSGSTDLLKKGYAVMPLPDTREEDWPVKEKILLISLHSATAAIIQNKSSENETKLQWEFCL